MAQILDFLTAGKIFTDFPELNNHFNSMENEMQGFMKSSPKSLQEYPFFLRFVQINNWPNVNYKQQIEEQPNYGVQENDGGYDNQNNE